MLRYDELTYTDIRKAVDPASKGRAKLLEKSVYLGSDKSTGVIHFKTTSGTTPGVWWFQDIRLLDYPVAMSLPDPDITTLERIRMSVAGDLEVRCNCLHPLTKIPLLCGEDADIEELARRGVPFWVYSTDDNCEFVPKLAIAFESGFVEELLVVKLDNNEELRVTEDHLFRLSDGSYKEAKNLQVGESLLPLYRRKNNGYEEIKSNVSSRWKTTHSLVASNLLFDEMEIARARSGEEKICTHHKDYKKSNNSPENLRWMGFVEHYLWHAHHIVDRLREDKEFRDKTKNALSLHCKKINNNPTEAMRLSRETNLRRGREILLTNKDLLSSIGKIEMKKKWEDPSFREKATNAIKERWKNKEYVDKMRVCARSSWETRKEGFLKAVSENNIRKNAEMNRNPETIDRQRIGKVIKTIRLMKNTNVDITVGNFIKSRYHNTVMVPDTENFRRLIGSFEDAVELEKSWNHGVISVERVKESTKVYDLSVEGTQNFLTSAGVVVHNCPAFLYWGWAYIMSQLGSVYGSKEKRFPKVRNPSLKGSVCKHLEKVLLVLPFETSKIVKDIK